MTATDTIPALREKQQQYSVNPDHFRRDIIKNLETITHYGIRPYQVFQDWCALVEDGLLTLRGQFDSSIKGEAFMPTAESEQLYERLRGRYDHHRDECFDHFSRATAALWMSAEYGVADTIGSVYMDWGGPSKWAGQFFTPFPVAQMMATMLGSPFREVQKNLSEAISKSIPAQARMLAGLALGAPQEIYSAYFITRVLPHAIEHYQPVAINDPACGSGVMFLAYSLQIPDWMRNLGLVQFYGQDIDGLCVRMARINTMLYGLNGFWAGPYFLEQDAIYRRWEAGDYEELGDYQGPDVAVTTEFAETAVPTPKPGLNGDDPAISPDAPTEKMNDFLDGMRNQEFVQLGLFEE